MGLEQVEHRQGPSVPLAMETMRTKRSPWVLAAARWSPWGSTIEAARLPLEDGCERHEEVQLGTRLALPGQVADAGDSSDDACSSALVGIYAR